VIATNKGEAIYYNASKTAGKDNRIYPIVHLFGDQYQALLDTGATHSFISPEIIKKYSIAVNAKKGMIQLANKSMVQRIGETELVELVCGKNQISAPFEVLEQEHPVVIGMDLFARIGFQVVGLPDPMLSADPTPAPVEDGSFCSSKERKKGINKRLRLVALLLGVWTHCGGVLCLSCVLANSILCKSTTKGKGLFLSTLS